MKMEVHDVEKSFDSQLLPTGEPTSEWGLDQLGIYAQVQDRQITDGEKSLTAAYWRLGHALALAKKAFKHGLWCQHLKDLHIDKTRASKAASIYRTFQNEQDVAGLRVDEAYAQRERRPQTKQMQETDSATAARKPAKALRKSIGNIALRAEAVIHDAAFAEAKEAVILIPAVRKAITQLQELLSFLEQQAQVVEQQAEAIPANEAPVEPSPV
jgi:hypothetical protein